EIIRDRPANPLDQRAGGGGWLAAEVLLARFHVQNHRVHAVHLARLDDPRRFRVDILPVHHAPEMRLQPVPVQLVHPRGDRLWPVDRHRRNRVVIRALPVPPIAGLDRDTANVRHLGADIRRQLVDRALHDRAAAPVPPQNPVVKGGGHHLPSLQLTVKPRQREYNAPGNAATCSGKGPATAMTVMLEVEPLSLTLRTPFTISYGTSTVRENLLLRLRTGDHVAWGEAAIVPYYHETPERVAAYLTDPRVREAIDRDPLHLDDALQALPTPPSSFARAAIDIALHDRWASALGQPLYRLWGLNPDRAPATSFTIAIDEDEVAYRERVRAAGERFRLLKIKLGGASGWESDWRRVQLARDATDAAICVDANAGWNRADALAIIPRLGELGV